MQDLSCFIGLLCKKRKGKDTFGIWSITQKVFVIEGITIDNKSISTEFSKIKKDRKPYIYFKKLIEKAVDKLIAIDFDEGRMYRKCDMSLFVFIRLKSGCSVKK